MKPPTKWMGSRQVVGTLSNIEIPERVTKLDAAGRQLATAIRLFFEGRDTISVHTLAAAAHGILRDLAKSMGKGSMITDNPLIRPERQKEFRRIINTPRNFFKHADRDPTAEVEFAPSVTEFLMLDDVFMYEQLAGKRPPEGNALAVWIMVKYPNVVSDSKVAEMTNQLRAMAGGRLERNDFLRLL